MGYPPAGMLSKASRQSGRAMQICMVTHSFYESDNRVMRYAEALAERGDRVEVLALRRSPDLPREEVINGVRLLRIQDRFGKIESSKFDYLWPVLRFLVGASKHLIRRHRREPYNLLHIHSVPDFLVFAGWYPRMAGARVILDIHDILPEFFASKFGANEHSLPMAALKLVERLSAAAAHHVILANHLWLEKYVARSAVSEKCSVVLNHVDERIFRARLRRKPNSDAPVVIFPGGLQWHQGLDIAIRAFGKLRHKLPRAEFHIYGDGNMKPQLLALVRDLGLEQSVRFFDPLPIRDIAAVMAEADLGVVAKRADSFGNEAYSTKIMEFMAVGVPVAVSSTRIDRHYYDASMVRFFESGNDEDMARAMFEVLTDENLRAGQLRRAAEYVAGNGWERHKTGYLELVDSLVAGLPISSTRMAQTDA